jgi:hypothetical protein
MKITPKQIKLTKAYSTNTNPSKMPTWTCTNCARVYKELNAYMSHRLSSDCTLKSHTAQDLHEAAQTAYNKIITTYVKKYYTSILEAVAKGKFTCALAFDYTDTDRRTLLTEVVTRLQKKFDGVVFTRHFDSSGFTVDWSAPLSKTEIFIKTFAEHMRSTEPYPVVKLKDLDFTNTTCVKEEDDVDFGKFGTDMKSILIKTDSDPPFTYFT